MPEFRRVLGSSVAEWAHFSPFWGTLISYRAESVHFFWGAYELSN